LTPTSHAKLKELTTNHSPPDDSIVRIYQQRRESFDAEHGAMAARTTRLMHARLILFFAALGLLLTGLAFEATLRMVLLAAAGCAFAGFIAAVVAHRWAGRKRDDLAILRNINQQAAARYERKWNELPETKTLNTWQHKAFARDLDLFGHASLTQLLGTAHTPTGRATVSRWLLEAADPEKIVARQRAVAERVARHADGGPFAGYRTFHPLGRIGTVAGGTTQHHLDSPGTSVAHTRAYHLANGWRSPRTMVGVVGAGGHRI